MIIKVWHRNKQIILPTNKSENHQHQTKYYYFPFKSVIPLNRLDIIIGYETVMLTAVVV